MRNTLIRLAVIATAAISLSACVYPGGYRHHGYYGGGGYHRDYGGGPRNYVYRGGGYYR
ncbi:MAG TPA: hypothetical protein VGM87_19150 [Roseomonas sp.]|jgi:hypothetical protein